MSEREDHSVSLHESNWQIMSEDLAGKVSIQTEGCGLKFTNNNNSVARFCCNEKTVIELSGARSLLITCPGKIDSNAGGYVLVNGFEAPINGQTVMPILGAIELFVEVAVNANSSVTIEGLQLSGVTGQTDLTSFLNTASDILVVTPTYPTYQNLYMSAFAHARNKAYAKSGLNIQVASLGTSWYSMTYDIEGVPVYKGPVEDLRKLLQRKQYRVIIVHFVDEQYFEILQRGIRDERLIFICHGPETLFEVLHNKIRPYDSEPLPEIIEYPERRRFVKVFSEKDNVDWVFVSDWLKKESEKVLGIEFRHAHVIGNFINEEVFPYREKTPEDRKKILVIRKFDNIRQHSLDIVAKSIVELSKRPFFDELQFSIYGDGNYYDELIEPIKDFPNVELFRTFLPQPEIKNIHSRNGVLLLPSRHDAHAVSMSEGASSGLVVVGSNVTSNPYFMDDEHNHTMVDPEDPVAVADVIERLYNDPEEFLQISKRLSDFVHKVSSTENTIEREIALIKRNRQIYMENKENDFIMDKIAVLIPCYNEEKTIGKVVRDFKEVLPEAIIYVYDNNSSDRTSEIAEKEGAIVRHEYQQGKGNVIRRMFREIDAECYIMVDGDDTYPAEYAREMAGLVLFKKTDMVVGDRLSSTYFTENKRPFHNFGNSLVRKCINTLFKSNIKDIMTGYRAFSYQFVKTFPVVSKGFEIETEMSIHAVDKNLYIENVIVNYRDRPEGSESKLNTFSDGFKVLKTIAKLWKNYKPLAFFSVLSLVLLLVSACFFVPVFSEYLNTGMVDRMPTLVVCGFTALAAIQSFFSGLILDTIKQKNRQDFEIALIKSNERS